MKVIRTLGFAILSTALLSFTNQDKLVSLINEIETSNTSAHYLEIAKKMESLTNSDDQNWYPSYYSAYSYVLSAFSEEDPSKIDAILDLAKKHIDKADNISPDNDEILCVESMIYSARILVNPQERGYKYGQKSSSVIQKAMAINSDNPRALFLVGQSKMYMPENYGGGCKNATPILKMALEKFKEFKKPNEYSPNWGEKETRELLKKCAS